MFKQCLKNKDAVSKDIHKGQMLLNAQTLLNFFFVKHMIPVIMNVLICFITVIRDLRELA